METAIGIYKSAMSGALVTTDSAAYVGRMARRYWGHSRKGICLVCNNLRPEGHEDSAAGKRGFWDSWHDPSLVAARMEAAAASPALELNEIKVGDLLACRRTTKDGRVENDCVYCRFLCDVLEAMFPRLKPAWEGGKDNSSRYIGLLIREGRPLVISCTYFESDPGWQHSRQDIEVFHPRSRPFAAGVRSPAIGPAFICSPSSDSDDCDSFVKECVQRCMNEHAVCRTARPSTDFVPSRLIYVAGARIMICDSWRSLERPEWMALSHCWGGRITLTLNRGNQERLKAGITEEELPWTFRNAITVARNLDFDYVWIDSLCILQDDVEDWQRESARMGEVYANAALVLSAGSSPNSETPFLGQRKDEYSAIKTVPLPLPDGTVHLVLARRRNLLAASIDQGLNEPPFTRAWATLRRPGPAYRRAWTFQEMFLAIRTIHYAPGGLIFECKTHRRSEGHLPPYTSTVEGTLGDKTDEEKWRLIVNAATHRQLTFEKDKLPSLSGIASAIQKRWGWIYLAGLWRHSLAIDILWQVMPGASHYPLAHRGYVAPSWSWASVNRGVVWNSYQNPQSLITITEAVCKAKGLDLTGEVAEGRLTITGRVVQCRIRHDTAKREYYAYFIKRDGKRSAERWFQPDGLLMWHGNGDIDTADPSQKLVRRAIASERNPWKDFDGPARLLCVAKTPWANFDHVGLLLGQSPTTERLTERLGCIISLPREWYACGAESTIQIV